MPCSYPQVFFPPHALPLSSSLISFCCLVLWLHVCIPRSFAVLTWLCIIKVHWIFELLTVLSKCKKRQQRCIFSLFFYKLWSLVTWGKWSPCVLAGKMEFIWFYLSCTKSLCVFHFTSDSPLWDIMEVWKVLWEPQLKKLQECCCWFWLDFCLFFFILLLHS